MGVHMRGAGAPLRRPLLAGRPKSHVHTYWRGIIEVMTEIVSSNICYLCGNRPTKSNIDHIFPKGLFNKPLTSNLPQLITCEQCNNRLSHAEELFRVFLASGMAYESNAGKRIWDERIRPDLKGKRPLLKPLIKSMLKQARVVNESGIILAKTLVLEVNSEPINRVLHKIAKGLYYLDTQRVLPSEVDILVGYDAEKPERFISPPLDDAIRGAKKVELGQGEVTYWRNIIKDNPEESLTWIRFYKDKIFLICTTRQDTSLG